MNMSGLNVLTAAPWRQTIGEIDYWLEPLTLSDWGIIEKRLLRERRNPLQLARENLAGLQADEKRALLEAALRQAATAQTVTADELMQYTATPRGAALLLWLSLRKRQPEITEPQAAELLAALGEEEFARLRADVQGQDGTPEDPAKK
jgi:hypothetical protein